MDDLKSGLTNICKTEYQKKLPLNRQDIVD